jgi:anti-sigma regulatory factor (Ser/Thr protein kinase)/serine/threonine protein phosphatase PrpC
VLSARLGFDETLAGRVALIVNELGSNLLKHAQRGRLLLAERRRHAGEIEILSIDEGPGIRNLDQSMRDGFSTGGTPGTGLGAARRLADDFDIHSSVPGGTLIVARVRQRSGEPPPAGQFDTGVVALCAPGEMVCGDGFAIGIDGSNAAALLADGLGHGPQAAEAAQAAIALFVKAPLDSPAKQLEAAHTLLRMTRGAAVSLVQLDAEGSQIRSAGAGNVVTRLVSGVANRTLLSQNGTVGVQIRRVEEIRGEWPAHALVVMHSDGLLTRWAPEVLAPLLARDPSLAAALLVRDFCRGRDDVTVVIVRRKELR